MSVPNKVDIKNKYEPHLFMDYMMEYKVNLEMTKWTRDDLISEYQNLYEF